MRWRFLIASICLVVQAAAQQAQTGSIRVTVKIDGTMEPLAGAQVTLRGTPTVSGITAATTPTISENAETDDKGIALFKNLAPGIYNVGARHDGYIGISGSIAAVTALAPTTTSAGVQITAQQPAQEVSLSLARSAAIAGRVHDAYGMPMPNARVVTGVLGYRDGLPAWVTGPSAQPDGRGDYRIDPLGSGEYYIRLESLASRGMGAFYPGVSDIESATRISITGGEEVVGIDFDMPNIPMFKVSGNVLNVPVRTGANGQPDNSVTSMTFTPADPGKGDTTSMGLINNARRGPNGEFEVSLPAGFWELFPVISLTTPGTTSAAGTPRYVTGRARVLVTDRDVSGVVIPIQSVDIKGRIVMMRDSRDTSARPITPRISLVPLEHIPSPLISGARTVNADSNGAFVLQGVPPGKYGLQMPLSPSGFYVADVRLGSKSIFDDGTITVGSEPTEEVTIHFNPGGARILGRVEDAASAQSVVPGGAAPPASSGRIVLVPDPPHRSNLLLYKTNTFGSAVIFGNARFTLTGVAPGSYKLFAFKRLPGGNAEQNQNFIAKYERYGTPITVTEGEAAEVTVRFVPDDQ